MSSLRAINRIPKLNVCAFSKKASKPPNAPSTKCDEAQGTSAGVNANVPGLSSKIVLPRSQPLGPGAATNGEYKVPEYYCYDRNSYHEAEVELGKYRCPQPSAVKK